MGQENREKVQMKAMDDVRIIRNERKRNGNTEALV
jgi:hypothetical protein